MKTLLILLSIVFLSYYVQAQWQPDVRVTNDPGSSGRPIIAVSNNFLHIVWNDNRDGNHGIYYKRSMDSGLNWSADIRLTNTPGTSQYVNIIANGSNVHVVWQNNFEGNAEIYYVRSTNEGANWSINSRLTNDPGLSRAPALSFSNQNIYVVWLDNRDGNNEIYFKNSTNEGISWNADTRLTNDPAISILPKISSTSSSIHIVWSDGRFGTGAYEIMYKRSTDYGNTWETDVRLSNEIYFSNNPDIAVSGSNVISVWEVADSNSDLFSRRSTNNGATWDALYRLTNDPAGSGEPSAAIINSTIHLVWQESRFGEYEIFYKRSTDAGINWEQDTRLTNDSANSVTPKVVLSGSIVHVVWSDTRDGNFEVYYKRNPTGNVNGITNTNSEIPGRFSLYQNYPNPFNPLTKIKFSIPSVGNGRDRSVIKIYNSLGHEVQVLVNESLQPGTYEVDWDASNFPSGVYFYELVSGNFVQTKKMVLLK
jgi:hypothetical protein